MKPPRPGALWGGPLERGRGGKSAAKIRQSSSKKAKCWSRGEGGETHLRQRGERALWQLERQGNVSACSRPRSKRRTSPPISLFLLLSQEEEELGKKE